jgi:hypothetical protein
MAYDRYDNRRDSDWRGPNQDRGQNRGGSPEDRGFFERAGDEIASWFGDDEAERRRRDDDRMNPDHGGSSSGMTSGGWARDREYDRGYGRDYDRDRSAFSQSDRDRDSDRSRSSSRPMNWTSSEHDYRSGRPAFGSSSSGDRDRGERSYRPMAGDYGRSDTQWGRDDYRNTSYAGSSSGTGRDSDRHYHAWRQQQLNDLDRDYDHYCREKQDKFENDFGSWRKDRMGKRQQLGQVREHMDVVGSDGDTVGKVDCVKGDRIMLTKSDSDDNRHHMIDCSMVDTVEGDQIRLNMPAEEAKSRFKDVSKRMFGRDEADREREGRTNLERSFSGTYDES